MSIDTRAQRAADGLHASARGVDPMTQIDELKREVKTRQRTGMLVTGAVVLALVVGALAVTTRWLGTDESATPAGPTVTDEARQVAADFLQAYGAYDSDRAMRYLTENAITDQWGSPEELRGELAWNQAAGWTELREPCQASKGAGSSVNLRCKYQVHALGSEQLGRGPYGDAYWNLHVRGGQIVYALPQFPFASNGFSGEMWEPFVTFVEASYPGDADVMYNADRTNSMRNPESLQLWEQHVADYVASQTAG